LGFLDIFKSGKKEDQNPPKVMVTGVKIVSTNAGQENHSKPTLAEVQNLNRQLFPLDGGLSKFDMNLSGAGNFNGTPLLSNTIVFGSSDMSSLPDMIQSIRTSSEKSQVNNQMIEEAGYGNTNSDQRQNPFLTDAEPG
jgi:hypothetical protein